MERIGVLTSNAQLYLDMDVERWKFFLRGLDDLHPFVRGALTV